jgi:hypothetical protein
VTACLKVDVVGACVVFDGVVVTVAVVAASVVDRLVAACVDVVVLVVAVAAAAFVDVVLVVNAAACVFVVDVVDIVFDGVVVTVAIVGASVVGRLVAACVNVLVVTATAAMWRTAFGAPPPKNVDRLISEYVDRLRYIR